MKIIIALLSLSVGLSAQSFVVSPLYIQQSQPSLITLNGVGTAWTSGTAFSLSGCTGGAVTGKNRVSATVYSLSLSACSATGSVTVTDTTDSISSTLTVATSPGIGSITVNGLSHASVNLRFQISGTNNWALLQYGTGSSTYGSYPFQSVIYQVGNLATPDPGNFASISLGGLTPATTYYVRAVAIPDNGSGSPVASSSASICSVTGCGSPEKTFTTAALPNPHPALPNPVSNVVSGVWPPNAITYQAGVNTSGYTIIAMTTQATGTYAGQWVASANYTSTTGCAWPSGVTAGDNISVILGEIGNGSNGCAYGTVLEFPQGVSGKVFPDYTNNEGDFATGYTLPAYALDPNASGSIDSASHRWIVFRTKQLAASDFPPFGFRAGPEWASKMSKFVAQVPGGTTYASNVNPVNSQITPSPGTQNLNGQIFDCYQSECHHFWFENLEFTHLMDTTVYPPGVIDPPAFTNYVRFAPTYPWSGTQDAQTPDYNVIDRVYAHGNPSCQPAAATPCPREFALFAPGGNHWAIISTYAQGNLWIPGALPTANPTFSPSVINIPQETFQWSALDATPIGMSGPATVTFTGASTYAGAFWAWLNTSGLTMDYQTSAGVSATCSGCTVTSEANPSRASIPVGSLLYFAGNFNGSGSASVGISSAINPGLYGGTGNIASILTEWRPLGIYVLSGNYGFSDNNFISAIGQPVYSDSSGNENDQTWTHNYFYFPRSKMRYSGQWDGYYYTYRNVLETKQGLRWLIAGNIFDGSSAYQNPGNAMYVAGSYQGSFSNGTQDFLIANNLFKHLSSGFQAAGAGAGSPPDSVAAERVALINNLFLDLNRGIYNNGGGGFSSGAFSTYPPTTDLTIANNTVDLTLGTGPAVFQFGGGSGTNTAVGEGLNLSSNFDQVSFNEYLAFTNQGLCQQYQSGNGYSSTPPASCPTSPFSATVGNWFTNYAVAHNTFVGGMNGTGFAPPVFSDMNQATFNSGISQVSGLGANVIATNGSGADNYAGRLAAANWLYPSGAATSGGWPSIAPSAFNAGDVGANLSQIISAIGEVAGISVQIGVTSAQLSYTAPDTRACAADISADSGSTWTRFTDAGGQRQRTLALSTSAATAYLYRLLCYFDQEAAFANGDTEEFAPGSITSGTFTTLASATRSPSFAFALSDFAGTDHYKVTMTAIGGAQYTNTCTASPCVVASVPVGDYATVRQYLTGAAVKIPGVAQTISIR